MIGRQIPLWGILCVLGGIGAQAVSVYYGQQNQAATLARLDLTVAGISAKLDTLAATQNTSALKDLEHDFKIADITARNATLEARLVILERRVPPSPK